MEFYLKGNTPAAPFASDPISTYVEAETPEEALLQYVSEHPGRVYALNAYASADDFHKNKDPLAQWLCNIEREKQKATAGKGSYSFCRPDNNTIEIDGEKIHVGEPFEGSIVSKE